MLEIFFVCNAFDDAINVVVVIVCVIIISIIVVPRHVITTAIVSADVIIFFLNDARHIIIYPGGLTQQTKASPYSLT